MLNTLSTTTNTCTDREAWPQLGRPVDQALDDDLPPVEEWDLDGERDPYETLPSTEALRFYTNEVQTWLENGQWFVDLPSRFTQLEAAQRGIYLLELQHPPDTTLVVFSGDGSWLSSDIDGFGYGTAEELPALFGALARQVVLLWEMEDAE